MTEHREITLRYQENSDGGRCVFCGEAVSSVGFDFVAGGQLVCHTCAAEGTPELFRIFSDARDWMETNVFINRQSANQDGRRDCANAIVAAVKDDLPARVMRECLLQLAKAGEVTMDDNEMPLDK